MKAPALLLCCSVLASCGKDPEPDREPVNLTAGVPVAGVAEVAFELGDLVFQQSGYTQERFQIEFSSKKNITKLIKILPK